MQNSSNFENKRGESMKWAAVNEAKLPTVTAYWVAALVLALAVMSRFFPHPDNVSPMLAASLVAGLVLGRGRTLQATLMTALAMILSDIVIGFHSTALFVYAGMGLAALVSSQAAPWILSSPQIANRFGRSLLSSALASIAGSFIFFLISNLGVWLVGELYPMTVSGFVACYAMALPFFVKSLLGDFVFGTAMLVAVSSAVVRFRGVLRLSYAR